MYSHVALGHVKKEQAGMQTLVFSTGRTGCLAGWVGCANPEQGEQRSETSGIDQALNAMTAQCQMIGRGNIGSNALSTEECTLATMIKDGE